MLLTRQQFRAHLMTRKAEDEVRDVLSYLRIDPTGRVTATNGHLAVIVTPLNRDAEAEYSKVPGLEGTEPEAPVYVHRDAAKAAEKIIPRKTEIPVLGHARLLVSDGILIGATDFSTPQLVMVKDETPGTWPDVDALMNRRGRGGQSVMLDSAYLALIAKYASGFGMRGITLTVAGPLDPVRFEWQDDQHRVVGALMPMRSQDEGSRPRGEAARPSEER